MSNKKSHSVSTKKPLIDLLMGAIFLILVSFALWLIWLTYFREYFDTGIMIHQSGLANNSEINIDGNYKKRFHGGVLKNAGMSSATTMCLICHEDMPHSKSREKRAFLNAHDYFMTCEVCHVGYAEGQSIVYRWVDIRTGQLQHKRSGDGEYLITPVTIIDGNEVMPDDGLDRAPMLVYSEKMKQGLASKDDEVWEMSHKNFLSDPISCVDCHNKERTPFLPLSALSYSDSRKEELSTIPVAGMVRKYEQFFLPNFTGDSVK